MNNIGGVTRHLTAEGLAGQGYGHDSWDRGQCEYGRFAAGFQTSRVSKELGENMAISIKKPVNKWGVAASILFILGAAIAMISSSVVLDRGTTPEELSSLITTYVVIGVLLGGVGQLMRTAAHAPTSTRWKLADGYGKAIGLLGWSLAFLGAVIFSANGTDMPEWVLALCVYITIGVAVLVLAVSLFSLKEQPQTTVYDSR